MYSYTKRGAVTSLSVSLHLCFTVICNNLSIVFYWAAHQASPDSKSICELILRKSYTMGCPPVRGDNPRAVASGLSYVQVDKHGITILYHLHQC